MVSNSEATAVGVDQGEAASSPVDAPAEDEAESSVAGTAEAVSPFHVETGVAVGSGGVGDDEETTSIAGTDEAAHSAVEAGDAAGFDDDAGDYNENFLDAEQLLREAIASRLPASSRRRDELEPARILTGHAALDAGRISRGDLVSVVGPSHVGKTQLLYSLIAGAIAPLPAGRGACVCYFEHLERLDTERVRRLLRDRLNKCGEITEKCGVEGDVDAAIRERLFVYRITSSIQLSVTLYSLLDHLHTRAGTAIDMVLIDGLGAMHYSDMNTNKEVVLMHMLRRLLRMRLVAVVVSECAILDSVSVGAKLLGISRDTTAGETEISADQIPTRPMSFMPREYAEDMVTHTVVLYYGENRMRRGALILRSPGRYSAQRLIASGELIVSSDLVTIQQQAEVMTCSERQ